MWRSPVRRGPQDDAAVRVGEQDTHGLKVANPAPGLFDVFRPGEQRHQAVRIITPRQQHGPALDGKNLLLARRRRSSFRLLPQPFECSRQGVPPTLAFGFGVPPHPAPRFFDVKPIRCPKQWPSPIAQVVMEQPCLAGKLGFLPRLLQQGASRLFGQQRRGQTGDSCGTEPRQLIVGLHRAFKLAGFSQVPAQPQKRSSAYTRAGVARQRAKRVDRFHRVVKLKFKLFRLGECGGWRFPGTGQDRVVGQRARRVDFDGVPLRDDQNRTLLGLGRQRSHPAFQLRQSLLRNGHDAIGDAFEVFQVPLPGEAAVLFDQPPRQPSPRHCRNQGDCEDDQQLPRRRKPLSEPHRDV